MRGLDVTVIEMTDQVSDGGNFQHIKGVKTQIGKLGIPIFFNTRATGIDKTGVACVGPEGERVFPADSVIYAAGRVPNREQTYALADCAPEFYPIGDSLGAKNILFATSQAFKIANAI